MTARTLLALLALALGGCGRLGYDPIGSEVPGDGGLPVTTPPDDAAAGDAWNPASVVRRPRFPSGGFSGGGFPRPPRRQ